MGQPITASHLSEIVSKHENFALLSHTRPDGDAVGSVVALKAVLEELGKNVVGLNEDSVPDNLRFLRGAKDVQCPTGSLDAEVVIALDTANRERLGDRCLASLSGAQTTFFIPLGTQQSNCLSFSGPGHAIFYDCRGPG